MELRKQKLKVEEQEEVKIFLGDKKIKLHQIDLAAEGQIIVELKAVKEFGDSHLAQVISYLKAVKLKTGLLLNFSIAVLKIKRAVN